MVQYPSKATEASYLLPDLSSNCDTANIDMNTDAFREFNIGTDMTSNPCTMSEFLNGFMHMPVMVDANVSQVFPGHSSVNFDQGKATVQTCIFVFQNSMIMAE